MLKLYEPILIFYPVEVPSIEFENFQFCIKIPSILQTPYNINFLHNSSLAHSEHIIYTLHFSLNPSDAVVNISYRAHTEYLTK